jgi:hypothetical protein
MWRVKQLAFNLIFQNSRGLSFQENARIVLLTNSQLKRLKSQHPLLTLSREVQTAVVRRKTAWAHNNSALFSFVWRQSQWILVFENRRQHSRTHLIHSCGARTTQVYPTNMTFIPKWKNSECFISGRSRVHFSAQVIQIFTVFISSSINASNKIQSLPFT